MALCAGVAAITLTLGVVGSLPAAARRLGAIHMPLPTRPIAAVLMMTSLVVVLARPRPATAAIPPPIVRLNDRVDADLKAADTPVSAFVSSNAVGALEPAPPIRSLQPEPLSGMYVVQPGDSLWRIAERTLAARDSGTVTSADIARFWPTVYEANRALIGEDPNLILPGQALQIPEV